MASRQADGSESKAEIFRVVGSWQLAGICKASRVNKKAKRKIMGFYDNGPIY